MLSEYCRMKATLTEVVVALMVVLVCQTHAGAAEHGSMNGRTIDEMSFMAGYGEGSITEGSYRPILLICRLGYDMNRLIPDLEKHRGTFSVYMEPQVNPVISPEADLEFGVGLGFKYSYPLTDAVSTHIFGSVGPHYISVVTRDQTNEFLFADTIGAGFTLFLTDNTAFVAEYRLRHLSNAHLGKPNGGINIHCGTIGYTVFF